MSARLPVSDQIKRATKGSDLELELAGQIRLLALPEPVREHVFAPPRKWRLDFYWPDYQLAVEVDGGTHNGGRHVRGKGYEEDCFKGCAAAILRIRVMHVTGSMVTSGQAIELIAHALA